MNTLKKQKQKTECSVQLLCTGGRDLTQSRTIFRSRYQQMTRYQSTRTQLRQSDTQRQFDTEPIVFGERFLFKIGWHPACLIYNHSSSKSQNELLHPKWWLFTPASVVNHTCLGGKFQTDRRSIPCPKRCPKTQLHRHLRVERFKRRAFPRTRS